jgi:hypothetical protein
VSDFGKDLRVTFLSSGAGDLTPGMLEQTGRGVLAQRLLCRQTTGRGTVIDCPNDCFDIRDWLSAGFTQNQISQLRGTIINELKQDVGVLLVEVQATYDAAAKALTVVEKVTSSDGPFTLTLKITDLTVEALITET